MKQHQLMYHGQLTLQISALTGEVHSIGCLTASSVRALSTLHSRSHQQQQGQSSSKGGASAWGLSAVAAAAAGMLFMTSGTTLADAKRAAQVNAKVEKQQQGKPTGGAAADASGKLPEYTADEVAQHKTPKDRVWVTYKDGVYDITDFIAQVGGHHTCACQPLSIP